MASFSLRNFRRGISSTKTLFAEIPSHSATAGDHGAGVKLWRNVSYYCGFPSILLCMLNAYLAHQKHHHDAKPEYVNYEYMGFKTKKFPWGDGSHSLFFNPDVNNISS